jgi:hypothetical protein
MASLEETLQSLDPQKREMLLSLLKGKMGDAPGGQPPGGQPPGGPPGQPGPMPAGGSVTPPGMLSGPPPAGSPLGVASPEEAARNQVDTARRANVPGMLDSAAGRTPAGNMFAGNKNWFRGMIDQTNRTGPFDSFYVDNARSDSWL